MSEHDNIDTLINSYDYATEDAGKLLDYFDGIQKPEDITNENLPALVFELQNNNSEKAKNYIKVAKIAGGGVATAIGTTLAFGSLATGVTTASGIAGAAAVASSYGMLLGIGTSIPIVGFFVLPVVAVPLFIKFLSNRKIKQYYKNNKPKLKYTKSRIDEFHIKFQTFYEYIQNRINVIDKEIKDSLSLKIKEYKEIAKSLAKSIAIEIDDIVNVGANERILKYNEIILKQYNLQKQLEDKMDFLYSEYDRLLKDKEELERKIGILTQLLNTMGCPEAVINQALSQSEK